MTDSRAGTVVAFYCYRGGTGRTMALANVAWILAANGKRVLAVDGDLDSPGGSSTRTRSDPARAGRLPKGVGPPPRRGRPQTHDGGTG